MVKILKRFIDERSLGMSDDDIRKDCPEKIGILYGFDNYNCSLKQIGELKEYILKDYPDTKDEDIEVWYIAPHESIRHARFTMLRISIPTEDFIELRKHRNIYIL
jgi:hypothetical protein